VINAFDKNCHRADGSIDPWYSRFLGRVKLALQEAGWRDPAGDLKETHLRALSSNMSLAHHESRGLSMEKGLLPNDRAQLRNMVEQHEPKVMVLVGDAALEAVTGHKKASKYAGSVEWVPDLNCWAVTIEDPFAWVMDYTKYHAAVRDLRKAVKIASGEEPVIRRADVEVLRDYEKALDAIATLRAELRSGVLVFAVSLGVPRISPPRSSPSRRSRAIPYGRSRKRMRFYSSSGRRWGRRGIRSSRKTPSSTTRCCMIVRRLTSPRWRCTTPWRGIMSSTPISLRI
jgi:hypothetical protein